MVEEVTFSAGTREYVAEKLTTINSLDALLALPGQLRAVGLFYNAVLLDYLICRELGLELCFRPCADDTKVMFWRMYGVNLFVLGG